MSGTGSPVYACIALPNNRLCHVVLPINGYVTCGFWLRINREATVEPMTTRTGVTVPIRSQFALCIALLLLGGCGTWSAEKYEAAAAAAIDSRLADGMSVDELRAEFPDAELVEGDEQNGAWFVGATELCFWCRSAHGFMTSVDSFARIVHVENGRSVRIEPVVRARVNE